MELEVKDQQKRVNIWLTHAESQDPTVQESLKPIYQEYKAKKYLVAVFSSGTEDLKSLTCDLLRYNPTEELSGGAAVAGAYHPALGELVKSSILYNRAEKLLEGIAPGQKVVLEVHPSQLSQMIGQHRQNITGLTERYSLAELKVRSGAEEKDEIRVIVEDDDRIR